MNSFTRLVNSTVVLLNNRAMATANARPKAASAKIHVLLVQLSFKKEEQRTVFRDTWSKLADQVYANEPNCLSYEFCEANDDSCKAIIYERYTNKADLDGPHQETLKAFGLNDKLKELGVEVDVQLTHFTETNTGFMDK
eukprot:m.340313 g.340313  ORF g.340313 m.340313 type:complete len:139 (+) comp19234_c0_seq1:33-449(+)